MNSAGNSVYECFSVNTCRWSKELLYRNGATSSLIACALDGNAFKPYIYHLILVMNCEGACPRFKTPTLLLCVPLQWTRIMCKCQHYVCVLVASFSLLKMQVSRGQKKAVFGNFCLLWETVLSTWITSLEMSQLKKYKTLASCFYLLSMTSIEYIRTQLFYW